MIRFFERLVFIVVSAIALPIVWALYGVNRDWCERLFNPMLRWNARLEQGKGGCLNGDHGVR